MNALAPVTQLHATIDAPIGVAMSLDSARALTGPGLRDVLAERVGQIDRHGFTLAHDMGHAVSALALAAISYFNLASDQLHGVAEGEWHPDPATWPWEPGAWSPGSARDNLIKALAIGLAVLDRLDFAEQAPVEPV